MSDIQIGASLISGFQPQSLGADIALSGMTVTLGNPNVTGSNFLPQSVVGLGGFKITFSTGITYTVATVTSRSALTLTTNYGESNGTVTGTLHKLVHLRVYVLTPFTPSGETFVAQSGAPGSTAWFRRYGVSVISDGSQNVAHIPQITLPATTNSNVPTARYFAGLYTTGGAFIQEFPGCVSEFRLDSATTPTSWAQICAFNAPPNPPPPQPINFYTTQQIDARFPSATAGRLLYYKNTGNVLTPLILSGEFAIASDTLSLAAPATGYNRVQEEGVNLPQRATLNFIGSSFTAADEVGVRTNVTADADLDAIASNSTNGIYARTGTGTVAARTITQPAAGITISNGDGVAGNPTFALANDLAALEGLNSNGVPQRTGTDTWAVAPDVTAIEALAGTGFATRTAADTWAQRSLTQPAAGLTITNPAGVAGNPTFALANDLNAVEGLSATGIAARTAADTWTTRTVTGTTGQVTLTNGDGVSGNPTVSLPTTVFLGTAGGSPAAGQLKGPDASGTNIAGANLEIAGGPGTGNAVPGLVAARYPLTTTSGSSLQALSTAVFPPWVSMHLINNADVTVTNTTTETSILGASQASSTKTIEAGLARAGRTFLIRLYGQVSTTGTPTLRIRLKLGSVTLNDTGAVTMVNNTVSPFGGFVIEAIIEIVSTGATGQIQTPSLRASYIAANGGAVNQLANAAGLVVVDLTAAQTFDVTAQWGTPSASNTLTIQSSVIDMSR